VELGYKNLAKGKKADWFADADKIHSFTFGPDAAKGTAMLGNTRDAFDQVWHLPTDPTPLTGRQWIEHFASAMGVEPRVRVMPVWSMTLVGLFVPVVREFKEMVYQYDRDYFFDSAKFTGRFEFTPTAPEQAVRAITG
jgi:nucleoside-diphosphate-sugar epimerase